MDIYIYQMENIGMREPYYHFYNNISPRVKIKEKYKFFYIFNMLF